MMDVRVETRAGPSYPVRVGTGALASLPDLLDELVPAEDLALISDDRVAEIHGPRVRSLLESAGRRVSLHTFPHGEGSKNRHEWARLTDSLLEAGIGRDGCVVALGGGVTGDLAGFVAATFMRGLPVVQVPTSLVAMIDSSVGGKTGIDLPAGKNLVGAFHPPAFVVADPDFTTTLPRRERAEGLVEAIKHGAILDASYFEQLLGSADALLGGDPAETARAVLRSVELKADVVSRDEHEGGLRQILNFGHTLGHALEGRSDFTMPHGTAVAHGMVLEAGLGERLGVTRRGTREILEDAARRLGIEPPAGPLGTAEIDDLIRRTARDKKARAGAVRYVLIEEVGTVSPAGGEWSLPVTDEDVRMLLSAGPV